MGKFKAVLFDLDGTLLDTIDDLADSMNDVLARNGFPAHGVAEYKYFVGDGIVNLVRRALPADRRDEQTLARLVAEQRREYGRRWADKTRPYDGIPQLLDALSERGLALAVLSNKPHETTQAVVAKFLSRWTFAVVRGEGPHTPAKPDPTGATQVAAQLGLPPAQCLYVGDTDTDMKTATAAGMYAAGALWGFRTADELRRHGAKTLLAHPRELLKLL
ncbi:MAG TPA: HAD family hydrolase [Phycisphaerales bacterium]|nr:HAD family hydrolase [Phycisphaerales bacterium]